MSIEQVIQMPDSVEPEIKKPRSAEGSEPVVPTEEIAVVEPLQTHMARVEGLDGTEPEEKEANGTEHTDTTEEAATPSETVNEVDASNDTVIEVEISALAHVEDEVQAVNQEAENQGITSMKEACGGAVEETNLQVEQPSDEPTSAPVDEIQVDAIKADQDDIIKDVQSENAEQEEKLHE